jgi:hypothetical protein
MTDSDKSAARAESAAESTWRSVRWLYPILFLLGLGLVASFINQQRISDNLDNLDKQVESTSEQVAEVKSFVDELQAPPSDDEQARNEAISAVLRLVPEIKSILCEQFPQATACNVP